MSSDQINPYAAPQSDLQTMLTAQALIDPIPDLIYRYNESTLMIQGQLVLPRRCVFTNQPVTDHDYDEHHLLNFPRGLMVHQILFKLFILIAIIAWSVDYLHSDLWIGFVMLFAFDAGLQLVLYKAHAGTKFKLGIRDSSTKRQWMYVTVMFVYLLTIFIFFYWVYRCWANSPRWQPWLFGMLVMPCISFWTIRYLIANYPNEFRLSVTKLKNQQYLLHGCGRVFLEQFPHIPIEFKPNAETKIINPLAD